MWIAAGLGKNERTRDDRLGVKGEAFCRPVRLHPVPAHGRLDVGNQRSRMAGDAVPACFLDRRAGAVSLLCHRANETGELGPCAPYQFLSEGYTADDTFQGIVRIVIGSIFKERARRLRPQCCAAQTARASLLRNWCNKRNLWKGRPRRRCHQRWWRHNPLRGSRRRRLLAVSTSSMDWLAGAWALSLPIYYQPVGINVNTETAVSEMPERCSLGSVA